MKQILRIPVKDNRIPCMRGYLSLHNGNHLFLARVRVTDGVYPLGISHIQKGGSHWPTLLEDIKSSSGIVEEISVYRMGV